MVRPWPPHCHLARVQGLRLQSLRHTMAPFSAWSWPWSARLAGAELSGAAAWHGGRRTAPTGAPAAPPALKSHTSSTKGDGGWGLPFPLPRGINGQRGTRGMGFVLGRGQRCKELKPHIRQPPCAPALPQPSPAPPRPAGPGGSGSADKPLFLPSFSSRSFKPAVGSC